ncbi:MAG: biosynthetic-type acetolactate synthase large subunit [Ktedonobacterales bacterium]
MTASATATTGAANAQANSTRRQSGATIATVQETAAQNAPALRRTGSQILCDALEQEGVEVMFGYPGGAIMPFYDAITSSRLRHVLVCHEQAAAHAADGYARASGNVGVCVATSGPGATNLVTGLATAFMDSVPVVAITGQVACRFIGTDAFQETDVLGVTQPVTKHSILVRSVEELAGAVHDAFAIARSGRPGPVVVDVPKDVLQSTGDAPAPFTPAPASRPTHTGDFEGAIAQAARMIDAARRPLILAGHGVILSGAFEELRVFAERTGIPVSTTLLGISAIPESHPLTLGMPGMHGPAEVNHAINAADLLIAVGMRFDDRVTGNVMHFAPNAQIIHIDIDPSEMGKVLPPTVPIVADARRALTALIERVTPGHHSDWMATIASWRTEAEQVETADQNAHDVDGMPTPRQVLAAIRAATDGDATVVTDVGQHQMWAARFYGYERPNSHLTSGGLGTMGFALPAAMGVAFARPQTPIWVVAGDGGIQMNIQELATIADLGAPIKVAILNNGYLGMVRQWQEFFHQRNYSETRITGPDYPKLAEAYHMTGFRVTRAADVEETIRRAMEIEGPAIIDFTIEQGANVFPMVPPGKGNTEMIERAPTAAAEQNGQGGRHVR